MNRRSTDRFVCFVSRLSTIAMMLGVMSLLMVLSVMNGFEHQLKDNILELMPQASLFSSTGSINPKNLSEKMLKLKGVSRVAPLTTGDVVLQSAHGISVGTMLGIDPVYYDPLTQYLVNVKQTDLKPGRYNVILGDKLAEQLDIRHGEQLRIIVPSASYFTPMGRLPSQRLFNVIGTFSTNSEVGSYQILVNIQDASRLMRYPKGNITGWRLWLNEPLKVERLSHQKLPEGTKWWDWRDRQGDLFQAVHMEKNIMGLLLSLIIAVAAFSIITSLCLTVMEKRIEIATLQTQGLTSWQITVVFIIQGASSGIIGTFLGILLASQLKNLMPIIKILFNGTVLPVFIDPLQVISVAFAAIVISLVSTLYPAWRAATTQPIKALRYE